jgi:hypothetical protein
VEKVDSTDFDNADDDEVNQYFNFELATEYNKDETYFILQDEKYKRVKELSKEEFEENDYYIRISIPFNYYVELNTEDMIGDPYNYDTYYQ